MAKKKIGVWVDSDVLDELDALEKQYDGLKGDLVAASIWLFVNATPAQKAEALKGSLSAKVDRFTKTIEAPEGKEKHLTPGNRIPGAKGGAEKKPSPVK